jgi:hypothetical protein
VDSQSGMVGEECVDLTPSMDTTIPEQVDRTPQMAQEVAEKGLDGEVGEIAGPTPEVEDRPCQRSPHTEPPGSGKLSPQGRSSGSRQSHP